MINGEVIGATSLIFYGHNVGKILAFAYVEREAAEPGKALEMVIVGEPRSAAMLIEPAYVPENLKPRKDR